jgi:hypothetical protein
VQERTNIFQCRAGNIFCDIWWLCILAFNSDSSAWFEILIPAPVVVMADSEHYNAVGRCFGGWRDEDGAFFLVGI